MEVTKLPLWSTEIATRKHSSRSMQVTLAGAYSGDSQPGQLEVWQEDDMVRLKADVKQHGQYSGTAYLTLTRENAKELCLDLAQRLGLGFGGV